MAVVEVVRAGLRMRNGYGGFLRIARRHSSPPPAATVSPPSPSSTHTPWTPPPTTKQELKGVDMVVSVRWVGILRPTEFTMSKALIANRRPPNPNRLLVDPLLDRRSDVNVNDNDDGGSESDGDDNNTGAPSSSKAVMEIVERKDEESGKGATGNGTSTPTTPKSFPVPPLQRGKDDGGDGMVGFVSWTPFNEKHNYKHRLDEISDRSRWTTWSSIWHYEGRSIRLMRQEAKHQRQQQQEVEAGM